MKATIYIPEEQAKIYEDAKEKLGESISKTFLRCLEHELQNLRLKTERSVVTIHNPETNRTAKKAFEGRFIVGGPDEGEKFYFDDEEQRLQGGVNAYAIALTKPPANRLVVLSFSPDGCEDLQVYENFEDFKNATADGAPIYPDSLIQAAASELDIEEIEELNI